MRGGCDAAATQRKVAREKQGGPLGVNASGPHYKMLYSLLNRKINRVCE